MPHCANCGRMSVFKIKLGSNTFVYVLNSFYTTKVAVVELVQEKFVWANSKIFTTSNSTENLYFKSCSKENN